MSALGNHFARPFDDLSKDVILIADDLRNAVPINSETLANCWLNLFDGDYHLEIRKYGTYERLFITTDMEFKYLKIIVGTMEDKEFMLKCSGDAVELAVIAARFDLKCLVSNIISYSITNFCSVEKDLLIWVYRLCKVHEHQALSKSY